LHSFGGFNLSGPQRVKSLLRNFKLHCTPFDGPGRANCVALLATQTCHSPRGIVYQAKLSL